MNKVKTEKGITLIALVITIVVLLILAGISITAGVFNIGKTQDSLAQSELQMVQHAVLEQYAKYQVTGNESDLKGTKVEESQLQAVASELGITLKSGTGYYKLDPNTLLQIGVKSAKDTYIVNYKTGEVINQIKKIYSETGEQGQQEKTKEGYVKNGLLFCLDGINNTGSGHDSKIAI